MATNLELKVRCSAGDLERVRQSALLAGSGPFSRLSHRDTFFNVPTGRLKLREIEDGNGEVSVELIGYVRPDNDSAKWSEYHRSSIPVESAKSLRDALSMTLGITTIVEKRREVAIVMRTRIHLDTVDRLGCFIELETVTAEAFDQTAVVELDETKRLLGLDRLDEVPGSYAELSVGEPRIWGESK
ncbi:class IV adenylate cyclase [soil metagenome]